jgi:uncharacterized protein
MSTVGNDVIAAVSGALTGIGAGFVGVGDGEFRIPVLVQLLKFPLKLAGGVNLVVGLFTVALSVARRWGQQPVTHDDLILIGVMGVVSVVGAAFGVAGREGMADRPLRIIFCLYLVIVGMWMLYESFTASEHILLHPTGFARWTLAAVTGFIIAVVSGVLGVAGGEMRIPALMNLFGVPVVEAGTLSLAVSVPTVAAGAFTDRRRLREQPMGPT